MSPIVWPGFPRIIHHVEGGLPEGRLIIPEDEAHHLISVLRKTIGDLFWIIDPISRDFYNAKIISTKPEAIAQIISRHKLTKETSYVRALMFALCKGEKNDLIAEKACELGVEHVIFWQANNSVVKIKDHSDSSKKTERWNRIAKAAAKQCGNVFFTECSFAPGLESAVNMLQSLSIKQKFFAALTKNKIELHSLSSSAESCAIVIGPEGDFSTSEIEYLLELNFQALGLGPLVLRAETAALVAISGFNSKWGFFSQ